MINLPRIVLVLFGLSALLDIAEKVSRVTKTKKKRRNKMNRHGCSCKEIEGYRYY